MTSLRKILANQQNAKRSTGPKTLHGRARASRNAIRHGLTLSPLLDPVFSAAVKKLARQLVGSEADRELYETACEFAEAQLELNRVRHQRHRLIARAHAEPFFETKEIQKKNSRLARRYYVAARR